jgi:hypothetical protein
MRWTDQNRLLLERDEWQLLLWNVLNEVLNGLKASNFNSMIGASGEEVKATFNRLRTLPRHYAVVLSIDEASIFRSALALTLQGLGIEEFQTRTDYDFEQAQTILNELNRSLPPRSSAPPAQLADPSR